MGEVAARWALALQAKGLALPGADADGPRSFARSTKRVLGSYLSGIRVSKISEVCNFLQNVTLTVCEFLAGSFSAQPVSKPIFASTYEILSYVILST